MMDIRRSMLFIPGNHPGMLQNGGVFEADSIILDLEDAVAPFEKDAARKLVSMALLHVDYGNSEKVVRINPLDCDGGADIAAVVPNGPDAILLPKVQSAAEIRDAARLIAAAEGRGQKPVKIIGLIETPRGLANALEIAEADPRVVALALGAEDYTAALGAVRTREGDEIRTARALLINAAGAAGIDVIDTPFTDVNDDAGLAEDARLAKRLGFKGKLAINPRQVEVIHDAFNPSAKDIAWAERVVDAIEQAKAQGSGVISVDGKMVDAPIVSRANRTLELARMLGITTEDVR
jgi:citrate lyase subunit beta/citryl-CoA lyase